MIGVGIAFVLVGIVFIIPWVGIPVGIVVLVLAILWLAGFGRHALRSDKPAEPHA
jgi:uncharacterized membrane protein YccF (DUF307 family)